MQAYTDKVKFSEYERIRQPVQHFKRVSASQRQSFMDKPCSSTSQTNDKSVAERHPRRYGLNLPQV